MNHSVASVMAKTLASTMKKRTISSGCFNRSTPLIHSKNFNNDGFSFLSTALFATVVGATGGAITLTTLHQNNPAFCESPGINSEDSHYGYQNNVHGIDEDEEDEERNFEQILRHHKLHLETYEQKWNWHNVTSRIPTVSWPTNIPDESDISYLKSDLVYCQRKSICNSSIQKNQKDDHQTYCDNLQFRIASYMLLQTNDDESQQEGLTLIKDLAERNHPDGMCSYGICLNDGRAGLEANPTAATSWWKMACDQFAHPQSMYELAVALYTGEGVPEDEKQAVHYFRLAAECGHAGAAYMLGDCLLDGVGCRRERGEALEWLVTSAELGHRGARSRVLAVLNKKDGESYGEFTDASRQTLLSSEEGKSLATDNLGSVTSKGQQPKHQVILAERRYTIGGGARNPAVLARRRTIVQNSRGEEAKGL